MGGMSIEPRVLTTLTTACLQVVEYNETSSLYEQLLQMKDSGVYISVHTSNLANSPLLQPGSAVFEILQVCDINMSCVLDGQVWGLVLAYHQAF
jgi:hypothetical protein